MVSQLGAVYENPFSKFYVDQMGGRNIQDPKNFVISEGSPQVFRGINVNVDDQGLMVQNYAKTGYSLFTAASINENYALIFARRLHAAALVVYDPYTVDMYPQNDPEVFADFQRKAALWRSMPQKPALPEEARKFRVLADDAVSNNEFDKAGGFYEKGLAIDPLWPVGQYNAACIYEELKNYGMAMAHMKRYLALKPDVKDARAFQDKIYIWQEKIAEAKNASTTGNRDCLVTYWVKRKPSLLGVSIKETDIPGKAGYKGVLIVLVVKDSPAFNADIFKGDIIERVNDMPIADSAAFLDLLKANTGKVINISIIRGGQEIVKSVQLNAASDG